MPRDSRPYVTYPLNYTSHPRIESLSEPAFRVFHEMNDYSRVHGLDGRFPSVVARKRWPAKALAELVAGIDDRPLVVLEGDVYVLRSYSDHQFTTADVEELRERRAAAGALGGKAKAAAKQASSKALASARSEGWQNVAESESRSESELLLTDMTKETQSSQVPSGPDSLPDEAQKSSLDRLQAKAEIEAQRLRISDLAQMRAKLEATIDGGPLTLGAAVELAGAIISRSATPVRDGDAYVATACRKNPADVRELASQIDLEAIA